MSSNSKLVKTVTFPFDKQSYIAHSLHTCKSIAQAINPKEVATDNEQFYWNLFGKHLFATLKFVQGAPHTKRILDHIITSNLGFMWQIPNKCNLTTNRMRKIQNVLQNARVTLHSKGNKKLDIFAYSCYDFLSFATSRAQAYSEELGIDLSTNSIQCRTTNNILGNKDLLEQVIQNLIKNASDHAFRDTVEKQVELTFILNNNNLELVFKDHGLGMDEHNLRLCRNPAFTTKKGGNGLGIPFIEKYLNAIGGSLNISSKILEGTTFTLTQPTYSSKTKQYHIPVKETTYETQRFII